MDLIASQFTYVTGSSLSYALSPLYKLDPVEVYSNLGIADCDVLSMILATRLNQAGISAGVITGELERKGRLEGGHAKVLYQDHEGNHHTYESTSRMREVITNFALNSAEEEGIRQISSHIASAQEPQLRAAGYRELKARLAQIMSNPENREVASRNESMIDSRRGPLDNLEVAYGELSYDQREALRGLLLIGAVLGAAGAGIDGTRRSYSRLVKRTMNLASEAIENPISTTKLGTNRGNTSKEVEKLIRSQRKFIGSSLRELERIKPGISDRFKGFQTLDSSELVSVIKYVTLLSALGPHQEVVPLLSLPQVLFAFRVHRLLSKSPDLVGIDQAFRASVSTSLSEKYVEKERAEIAERVSEIMEDARELAIESENPVKGARRGGVQPLGNSKLRSLNRSDEFHGFRELQPGEGVDWRLVDWRASARTDGKILLREFETPRMERADHRKPVHLVVDLSGAYHHSFRDLAAILILKGGDRRILSLKFCAHGEVLKSLDEKILRHELQGINNLKKIEKLIHWSLDKKLDLGFTESQKAVRARLANNTLLDSSQILFPSGLIHRTEETAVFGNRYFRSAGSIISVRLPIP